MQVLCKLSNTVSDVRCKVCGQGFLVYWTRSSRAEHEFTRTQVLNALADHHTLSPLSAAHPREGFNVPAWSAHAHPQPIVSAPSLQLTIDQYPIPRG